MTFQEAVHIHAYYRMLSQVARDLKSYHLADALSIPPTDAVYPRKQCEYLLQQAKNHLGITLEELQQRIHIFDEVYFELSNDPAFETEHLVVVCVETAYRMFAACGIAVGEKPLEVPPPPMQLWQSERCGMFVFARSAEEADKLARENGADPPDDDESDWTAMNPEEHFRYDGEVSVAEWIRAMGHTPGVFAFEDYLGGYMPRTCATGREELPPVVKVTETHSGYMYSADFESSALSTHDYGVDPIRYYNRPVYLGRLIPEAAKRGARGRFRVTVEFFLSDDGSNNGPALAYWDRDCRPYSPTEDAPAGPTCLYVIAACLSTESCDGFRLTRNDDGRHP